MRLEFYGLVFEAPRVTCYLWSPWRASALEHRLFEVVRALPGVVVEQDAGEVRAHLSDAKTWKAALHGLCRVLKGWQEEADPGREKRTWRWLLEGDTDDSGYDHAGEPACLWAYLRVAVERGNIDEDDKGGEDVDLNDFGLRLWPERS